MRDAPARFLPIVAVVFVAMFTVACRGNDEAATLPAASPSPSASAQPPGTPTPARSPEDEVSAAYLAYWDAYRAALLELDPALVERVTAGDELERIREEIGMLRADGVAARLVIEHDFAVVQIDGDRAVIIDQFLDRSFYVDPVSKEPSRSDVPGRTVKDTFHLKKQPDGTWVVVLSVREREQR